MILKKTDGTIIVWNVNKVLQYRYDFSTAVNSIEQVNTAEVKIYPNPSRDIVNILYELPKSEKVSIDILDIQGRVIKQWPAQWKEAGKHQISWQPESIGGRSIQSGTYVCRFVTPKGIISKLIIIE